MISRLFRFGLGLGAFALTLACLPGCEPDTDNPARHSISMPRDAPADGGGASASTPAEAKRSGRAKVADPTGAAADKIDF